MSRETDGGEWHVTTDHDRIRAWAERWDRVPVLGDDDDEHPLDVVTSTGNTTGETIRWDNFFKRFESEELAFRYREPTGGGADERACTVVRQATLDGRETVDEKPMSRDDTERDGETTVSESARTAEEPGIVLDEVYEDPGGFNSDPEEEYLVFENTTGDPVDMGGWSVVNDDGWSYEFPASFVLQPGEQVTLHSGTGRDADAELYWGADDSVWDPTGDTVELRTAEGDRVVYEPIKGG